MSITINGRIKLNSCHSSKVTNGLWEGYQLLNTANYTACLFISLKSVYKHSCPINYSVYCEHCMLVIALMPKQGDQKS